MFQRVFLHKEMISDQIRMNTYRKAIHAVVKKGDIVADIGTGSGILAFFAIEAGAQKVYAIEQDAIIEEAEKLAKLNGLEKKIVFIKDRSDNVELPERVNLITSELIGFFGLEENLHRFKIDARQRFLKPAGRLVPSWLELYLAPVESQRIWQDNIGPWHGNHFGFDFSPVRNYAVSQRYITDCSKDVTRLAEPSMISHLDFYTLEKMPTKFRGEFTIEKPGEFHGLMGYFRSGLAPKIALSTADTSPSTHWKQTFFPMNAVVAVEAGDEVNCTIKAIARQNTVYWEWRTSIHRKGRKLADFNQCNLDISKEQLTVGRMNFKPVLTQSGDIYRDTLGLCDGRRSVEEISGHIRAAYPDRFPSLKDAVKKVVDIVTPLVNLSSPAQIRREQD